MEKNKSVGRPTKISDSLIEDISESIRFGNYIETAAATSGISKDTLYRWLKKGARSKTGIFKSFSDAIQKAQAESEDADVKNITAAGASGQWQASAWRLERKFYQRWGRKDKIDLNVKGKVTLNFDKDDKEA